MKKYAVLIAVRKMQIKPIIKYSFLPTKLAILYAGKDREQQVMSRIAEWIVNW